MRNKTYAPWEHYPKTLCFHEAQNPMIVLEDFFNADSVKGHIKQLIKWRYYVINNKHYNDKRYGPGFLLDIYELNLKILEAMFLLLRQYKNESFEQIKPTEQQLGEEKKKWNYYPKNLSLKEQLKPYNVVKKIFKKIKPQEYRDHLREWVHVALYIKTDKESIQASDVVEIYENLLKLYSATWLIYQRESSSKS